MNVKKKRIKQINKRKERYIYGSLGISTAFHSPEAGGERTVSHTVNDKVSKMTSF